MESIVAPAHEGSIARLRVVMLSAAYTKPVDFVHEGFVGAVRERGLDVDLVFARPGLLEQREREVAERLRSEFLAPARAQGVALWLGGISLGGYAALCCAVEHAAELAGLCLFAPYLGSHITTGEILRAGGIGNWRPAELTDDDYERRIWRFIAAQERSVPAIHLGLGREDRFLERQRLFADALDTECVDIIPGGHDWPTWRRLWENFLDARIATPKSAG